MTLAATQPSTPRSAPPTLAAAVELAIRDHEREALPRLERLWSYYRNPMRIVGESARGRDGRAYRLAQEAGLPRRIIGKNGANQPDLGAFSIAGAGDRREVVIENDIAWRIHTMVDFMFGKPVQIVSTARDEKTRRAIERVLDAVWESSGGIALLQDIALLGHVYGHVDLVLRAGEDARGAPDVGAGDSAQNTADLESTLRLGETLRVEVIEPRRGVPIVDENDYRRLKAYAIHFRQTTNEQATTIDRITSRAKRWFGGADVNGTYDPCVPLVPSAACADHSRKTIEITEIITPEFSTLSRDGKVVARADNTLTPGRLPVVHIQNASQPFRYEGQGEVEPLIPLQDELNTRLSDRACRVTMQSFKMYLAKGIEGFDKVPVGPGMVWMTDNPDAEIQSFGGDAASPSEESHIQEIREALDKTSAVPPLASGVVRAKIGNLTSANALKITMMGIISKTARKRVAYGRGIAEMSRLIVTALDELGLLHTEEADRGVRLEWPDPLPIDVRELVDTVEAKAKLGAPRERLLAELGYAPSDPGVT
jgi:hypothetical protein